MAGTARWLPEDYAFPSRTDHSAHMSTRQYARLAGLGQMRKSLALAR